jgi:Ca2+-binding EF-hand superfamily protein
MKKQFRFSSRLQRFGACAFVACLLAKVALVRAQETITFAAGAGIAADGTNFMFKTGPGAGVGAFFINGSDIGTVLMKTCDLDADGKVTPAELKTVATASLKLWDTNSDGNVSTNELSAGLKDLFPAPPEGGARAIRVINGVATETAPGEIPTPDVMVARRLLAGVDANKDGVLSLQEVNDFLDKSFAPWDRNGNGSLDGQELGIAFAELSLPDEITTSTGH